MPCLQNATNFNVAKCSCEFPYIVGVFIHVQYSCQCLWGVCSFATFSPYFSHHSMHPFEIFIWHVYTWLFGICFATPFPIPFLSHLAVSSFVCFRARRTSFTVAFHSVDCIWLYNAYEMMLMWMLMMTHTSISIRLMHWICRMYTSLAAQFADMHPNRKKVICDDVADFMLGCHFISDEIVTELNQNHIIRHWSVWLLY